MSGTDKSNEQSMERRKIERILCISGFLDLFGVSMLVPNLSIRALQLGASPSMAGFVGSIYGGLQLVSSPTAGRLSDTRGHRSCLLLCLAVSALGYLFTSLANSVLFLMGVRALLGIFKHSQSLSKACLADIVPKTQLSEVQGRFNACSMVGFILGPMIGGRIFETEGGFSIVAAICGILFAFNFILIWMFLPHQDNIKENSKPSTNDSETPWTFLKTINWHALWDLFLVQFCLAFSVMLFRSNFSLIMKEKFAASSSVIGDATSLSAAVAAGFGFLVGHVTKWYGNEFRLYRDLTWMMVLCLTLLSVIGQLWPFLSLLIPLSMTTTILRVAGTSITLQRGGKGQTGTLLGFSQSIFSSARMLSPFLSGVALEFHHSGPTLIGMVMAFVAALIVTFRWKEVKAKKE